MYIYIYIKYKYVCCVYMHIFWEFSGSASLNDKTVAPKWCTSSSLVQCFDHYFGTWNIHIRAK